MQWKLQDIPSLLHHLPGAVHDLLHHEDKKLVTAGVPALVILPPGQGQRHHITELHVAAVGDVPKPKKGAPPELGIAKTIDPLTGRGAHNMELLLHDYLFHLPHVHAESREGEKLLEHWRELMLDQPRRLAVAKQSYWNTPEAREFWKHRLAHYRTDAGIGHDGFPEAWDDWQRMAGTELAAHPAQLAAAKEKQWQDLVIRSRLHEVSRQREMEW